MYVNGSQSEFDDLDPNKLSYFTLHELAAALGYDNVIKLYYRIPTMNLTEGLRLVCDDKSVYDMCDFLRNSGGIEIYVEHDIDIPDMIPPGVLLPALVDENVNDDVEENVNNDVDDAVDADVKGDVPNLNEGANESVNEANVDQINAPLVNIDCQTRVVGDGSNQGAFDALYEDNDGDGSEDSWDCIQDDGYDDEGFVDVEWLSDDDDDEELQAVMQSVRHFKKGKGVGVGINSKRIKVGEDSNWRPWLELPEDLLDLISKELGVIDYIMFGCVCKSWRLFSVACKEEFMASQPPLVLLISTHAKRSCYFYSLFDKRVYKTTLPNLTGKRCSGVSCGYLIMLDNDYEDNKKEGIDSEIWLVNPFKRELHFPGPPYRYCHVILASLDMPEPKFVIIAFSRVFPYLQFCRSGDVNWTVFEYENHDRCDPWMIIDVTVFKGKIYVLTSHAEIGVLNLNSDPMVTLLDVKSIQISSRFLQLVASGEQLLVVDFHLVYRPYYHPYAKLNVYRLDFSKMELVKVVSFRREKCSKKNNNVLLYSFLIMPRIQSPLT